MALPLELESLADCLRATHRGCGEGQSENEAATTSDWVAH
jgi:hypothetical protein